MKVIWSIEARDQLDRLFIQNAMNDLERAIALDTLIRAAGKTLARFPYIGFKSRIAGAREFIVERKFKLIYEICNGRIDIITIMHV